MGKLRITADEFAERVIKATDGRISIVKETYTGTRNKVTAFCNVHKIYFNVNIAYGLTNGDENCPECSKELKRKNSEERKIPFNEMLKRFQEAYGDKFSYDESSYCGRKKLMKVHCNDCGEDFEITPNHHLKYNNGGCPNCHKFKIIKCPNCNYEYKVDRHCSLDNIYCPKCNCCITDKTKFKHSKKEIRYCRICGRPLNEHNICENKFCHNKTVYNFKKLIEYFGFDESKLGTIYVEQETERISNILKKLYWDEHLSSTEICKMFNYPSIWDLTYTFFNMLNIKRKTVSEATAENIKMNRVEIYSSYKFKNGYHITWDGNTVYLRSSYEFDYAKYLDENKIKYKVEELRIEYFDTQKNRYRTAIPDFYLTESNTIIEIKSNWTINLQNMFDKRTKYLELGYNFKLILEHKETNLEDVILKKDKNFEYMRDNKIQRKYTTHPGRNGWKWMNNGKIHKKVMKKDINEYLNNGWMFGWKLNK